MPILVLPQLRYSDSFIEAEREYRAEGRRQFATMDALRTPIEHVLDRMRDFREDRDLPTDFVPATMLWLVDDQCGELLGGCSIRHRLNEHLSIFGGHIGYMVRPKYRRMGYGTLILRLALPKARELGIERVLLTCDKTNIASRKIIEANGGILENEADQGPGQPPKLRFWIET